MNKIGLIIGREYFTRVKKKSFLLTTILVPLVILGFYVAIIAIAVKGGSDKQLIGIVDEGGIFSDSSIVVPGSTTSFKLIKNETENSFIPKYKSAGYSAFIYVPKIALDAPSGIVLHSTASASMSTLKTVRMLVNGAVQNKRLVAGGIDPVKFRAISAQVNVENTIDTNDGSKKGNTGVAYGFSLACGMLIYLMMIIYGTQVMRGVTEEKTNRIAEVVISSVKPFELMMGKIIGIGAVGLTQFAIWILLATAGTQLVPLLIPAAAGQGSMLTTFFQGLASLPLLKSGFYFLFYFLGGYLTYASLFAAVGSVVSEDQQEAQQLMFPILMPIILGFVIMMQAINEPNSSLAVFGSLFPLTSPIVMMGRITSEIPLWQVAASMLLLVGCFLFLTWITGKIYRTGILMYGKKPSWKEMLKWAFRKS
ncbi:ABC transporter permease [Ferruginibacter sp. HRS2-29]|uniref:ABC transporter permease n=1 Tax=Ferruginibacter sp. HRS2-29 TaxID=2487334 RepID=UPI0020CDDA2A|nr:ABC transporter permease [Ferruginibacter sp. HRS2-29]MCP9751748.1 ABC transporter permease [Ferruginibacter sp. HRS2-29]